MTIAPLPPHLYSCCSSTAALVEGNTVDVVYLDFSEAFDTLSHSILLEQLAAHGLDSYTLGWGKN